MLNPRTATLAAAAGGLVETPMVLSSANPTPRSTHPAVTTDL